MKRILFMFLLCMPTTQLFASNDNSFTDKVSTNMPVVKECTGEFKINGVSYTITLHDVDFWTCAKFKVASWFN